MAREIIQYCKGSSTFADKHVYDKYFLPLFQKMPDTLVQQFITSGDTVGLAIDRYTNCTTV